MLSTTATGSTAERSHDRGVLVEQTLEAALADVARCFNERAIREKRIDATEVLKYYRQCDRVYRRYHSHEGALHVGLVPPGVSRPHQHGHGRHADLFGRMVASIKGSRAIEFGCGNGYNIRLLAESYPSVDWTGVDLSPQHVQTARSMADRLPNARFKVQNYLTLDEPRDSFDAVLAIETLCQTECQSAALREAFRVLRPGGRMMVFDCFRSRPLEAVSPQLAQAAVLVEKTAAVENFAVVDRWLHAANEIGFREIDVVDRSEETLYDLTRLYRMARRYFKLPAAARLLSKRIAPRALENVICGLLMPYTVGQGIHRYCSVVLEKPAH
jgi:arsenite methyltransferase